MSLANEEFSTPGIFILLVIGTPLYLGVKFMEWYGHLIVDWCAKFGIDATQLPGIVQLTELLQ